MSDAVTEAVENLRQAMLDRGDDPDTVEAQLRAVKPKTVNMVGNYADLQRAGERVMAVSGDSESTDYESMTKAELQAELDARGIEYSTTDTKADLIAALQ